MGNGQSTPPPEIQAKIFVHILVNIHDINQEQAEDCWSQIKETTGVEGINPDVCYKFRVINNKGDRGQLTLVINIAGNPILEWDDEPEGGWVEEPTKKVKKGKKPRKSKK